MCTYLPLPPRGIQTNVCTGTPGEKAAALFRLSRKSMFSCASSACHLVAATRWRRRADTGRTRTTELRGSADGSSAAGFDHVKNSAVQNTQKSSNKKIRRVKTTAAKEDATLHPKMITTTPPQRGKRKGQADTSAPSAEQNGPGVAGKHTTGPEKKKNGLAAHTNHATGAYRIQSCFQAHKPGGCLGVCTYTYITNTHV